MTEVDIRSLAKDRTFSALFTGVDFQQEVEKIIRRRMARGKRNAGSKETTTTTMSGGYFYPVTIPDHGELNTTWQTEQAICVHSTIWFRMWGRTAYATWIFWVKIPAYICIEKTHISTLVISHTVWSIPTSRSAVNVFRKYILWTFFYVECRSCSGLLLCDRFR